MENINLQNIQIEDAIQFKNSMEKEHIKLQEKSDGWWLEMAVDDNWTSNQKRDIITTGLLGKAKIPDAAFEQPDGTPYRLDTDYFGKKRNIS